MQHILSHSNDVTYQQVRRACARSVGIISQGHFLCSPPLISFPSCHPAKRSKRTQPLSGTSAVNAHNGAKSALPRGRARDSRVIAWQNCVVLNNTPWASIKVQLRWVWANDGMLGVSAKHVSRTYHRRGELCTGPSCFSQLFWFRSTVLEKDLWFSTQSAGASSLRSANLSAAHASRHRQTA